MRLFPLFLIAVIMALAATPVRAGTDSGPPETPQEIATRNSLITLLAQKKYDALDKAANQLQLDYESGKLSDIGLLHISRAFYDTNPALEDKYEAWIAGYPKSYMARMAQSMYFSHLAFQARGDKYISETPPQQITGMEARLTRALVDDKIALSLTAKPILTYQSMMGVVLVNGDKKNAQHIRAKADEVDPKNFIVRYKYLMTLQTRWGGSLQQMIAYRDEVRKILPASQISYFDAAIGVERDWLAKNKK